MTNAAAAAAVVGSRFRRRRRDCCCCLCCRSSSFMTEINIDLFSTVAGRKSYYGRVDTICLGLVLLAHGPIDRTTLLNILFTVFLFRRTSPHHVRLS